MAESARRLAAFQIDPPMQERIEVLGFPNLIPNDLQ
jgi:hypothetical protein